jgi:hypothetical protein
MNLINQCVRLINELFIIVLLVGVDYFRIYLYMINSSFMYQNTITEIELETVPGYVRQFSM